MSIRTVSTREVYRNPWLRLREDQIERNGSPGIYGVVEKDDCAVILPIEGDTVCLVEQFRYTIQQRALELPRADGKRPTSIRKNWRAASCAKKPDLLPSG